MGRTESWGSGARWSVAALAVAAVFVLTRLVAPDLLMRALSPVWAAGNLLSARATGLFALMGDEGALARKNAMLAAENAALALENRTLAEKLADLEALLGPTAGAEGAPGVVAGVLARPPSTPYDTLVLATGTTAGVHVQMEAYGAGGVPLGVVFETSEHVSRVRLFSAPGTLTDAWVGPSRVPVTLRGAGAGAFTTSASQGSGIVEGDTVYSAGPGAVPVGTVARITGAASDPVATLSIAPTVNPFSITWVVLRDVGRGGQASSTLPSAP